MGGTPLSTEEINDLSVIIIENINYLNTVYNIFLNRIIEYYYKIYNYWF